MNQSENNEELPVVLYTSSDGQVRVNALIGTKSKSIKQGMMQELLTGKTRLKGA